jgi:hypothetical protein
MPVKRSVALGRERQMQTEAEIHQQALLAAFATLLQAEEDERQAEQAIKAVRDAYAAQLRHSKAAQASTWATIAQLMNETGELEVILPDETHDYKVTWNNPPEVVDVPDPNAVPDEWCRSERTVKKKELLEHLKSLRDHDDPLPNWATIRRNPPTLSYRLLKKGGA